VVDRFPTTASPPLVPPPAGEKVAEHVVNSPGQTVLRSFVGGQENRLAAHAVSSIFQHTGYHYNPLVLCGPIGVGKSRLARGIVEAWQSTHANEPAHMLPAVDFARLVGRARRGSTVPQWRRQLLAARLLVLEDVERLAGREAAQRELAQLVDELLDAGGLLVVTCKEQPAHCRPLAATLRSRLSSGLVVKVSPPDRSSRLDILRRSAAARSVTLTDSAAELLAAEIRGSAGDLVGALLELETTCKNKNRPISSAAVRRLLNRRAESTQPSLSQIITATARYFSLPAAVLQSPSRRLTVVAARGVAMYLARELTDLSLNQIGRAFGRRDHTTVLHNCRKIAHLLPSDREVAAAVAAVRSRLAEKS